MNTAPSGYFALIEAPLNELKAALIAFQHDVDATITGLSGGVGLVNSVFGRSGEVEAEAADYSAFYLKIASNLSDLANPTTARSNLGVAIGSDVQAWDADLDAIAAIAATSGLLKKTAANTWILDTSTYATQAYADALVVGLLDDRGNYDASGNTFPASGGSGGAGAILKGDLWTISVAGTLGGQVVTAGDIVRALVDTPGQTAGNWAISETNIGYVPLNAALADGKIYVGNGSGIGSAVTPTGDVTISNAGVTAIGALKVTNAMLAGAIDASKIADGSVSNAEFQFINSLNSNAQTQLDGKQPLDADLTTIAGLTATTNNFIVAVASAWASRTPAQVKTTLSPLT